MPALPSGQHIALDPAPLNNLLCDATSPLNAHNVMAIQQADDLMLWFDVLVLKPADVLTADERVAARPVAGGSWRPATGAVARRPAGRATVAADARRC